jgi:hypothetical protein
MLARMSEPERYRCSSGLAGCRALTALLLVLLATTLAACSSGDEKKSSASRTDRPIDLAMALAPRDASSFEFTDVRAVAKGLGADLEHGSIDDKDESFFTQLKEVGNVWINYQPSLWHVADTLWQSTAGPGSGANVSATGLRSSFDMAKVERKFAACKYKKRAVGNAVVYEGSQSAFIKCAGDFGVDAPVQRQIGLLKKEHVILLAGSAEDMDSAIRKEGDLHRSATAKALLAALSRYPAVTAATDASFCKKLSTTFVGRNATPELVKKALADNPPGAAYRGFAFGSRFEKKGHATGSLVFNYADEKTAREDLTFREHALRTETSAQTNRPYSDLVKVDSTRLDGQNAVLNVAPPDGGPLRVYDIWLQLDLAFARC